MSISANCTFTKGGKRNFEKKLTLKIEFEVDLKDNKFKVVDKDKDKPICYKYNFVSWTTRDVVSEIKFILGNENFNPKNNYLHKISYFDFKKNINKYISNVMKINPNISREKKNSKKIAKEISSKLININKKCCKLDNYNDINKLLGRNSSTTKYIDNCDENNFYLRILSDNVLKKIINNVIKSI